MAAKQERAKALNLQPLLVRILNSKVPNHIVELDDPRVSFCRYFNEMNTVASAVPIHAPREKGGGTMNSNLPERVALHGVYRNLSSPSAGGQQYWQLLELTQSRDDAKADIEARRAERKTVAKQFGGNDIPEHKLKIVRKRVIFSGTSFLVVAAKRPEEWSPRHVLDLPPTLEDGTNGAGYAWNISIDQATRWQTRDAAIAEVAEANGRAGDIANREPDDWHVVVEIGDAIDDPQVRVQITNGVGHIEMQSVTFPIRVVRPTTGEIKEFAATAQTAVA